MDRASQFATSISGFGGEWHIVMRMPDGSGHPFRGICREMVPNERLVYGFTGSDQITSIGDTVKRSSSAL